MDSSKSLHRLKFCSIRKICGSTHFHYENVELGPLKLWLEGFRFPSSHIVIGDAGSSENGCRNKISRTCLSNVPTFTLSIESNGRKWIFRRTLDDFCQLDKQLHRCVYDRRYSKLPELENFADGKSYDDQQLLTTVREYILRFGDLAGSLITCYPVLKWFELDNRGNHLFTAEETLINTPAKASAYVVRDYEAQSYNEISLNIGDIISVIDMPTPTESFWWRGKLTIGRRGSRASLTEEPPSPVACEVGFFPSECVQLFGPKLNIVPEALRCSEHEKPVFQKRHNFVDLFRDFFAYRPPRRRLKESGILHERVFGCDLAEHLQNTGQDMPAMLKFCCSFIESRGIVDGIYRLSGASSNIQRLRYIFDEKREPVKDDTHVERDVHCVASVLKMYFRELPTPLLTFHLYPLLVNAAAIEDNAVKLLCIHDIVQQLPPPYFRTAEFLLKHLSKIAEHSSKTGMTFQNLSIVWAPNLLKCPESEYSKVSGESLIRNVNIQAVIIEYMIKYVDLIFSRKLPSLSNLQTPSVLSNKMEHSYRPDSMLFAASPKTLIERSEVREPSNRKDYRLMAINNLHPPDLTHRKCIDVNGGPAALPAKYHTVIEGPSCRSKPRVKKWKSLFGSVCSAGDALLSKKLLSTPVASKSFHSTGRKKKNDVPRSPPVFLSTNDRDDSMRQVKSAENLASMRCKSKSPVVNSNFRRDDRRRSLKEAAASKEFLKPKRSLGVSITGYADLLKASICDKLENDGSSNTKENFTTETTTYKYKIPSYTISVHVNVEPSNSTPSPVSSRTTDREELVSPFLTMSDNLIHTVTMNHRYSTPVEQSSVVNFDLNQSISKRSSQATSTSSSSSYCRRSISSASENGVGLKTRKIAKVLPMNSLERCSTVTKKYDVIILCDQAMIDEPNDAIDDLQSIDNSMKSQESTPTNSQIETGTHRRTDRNVEETDLALDDVFYLAKKEGSEEKPQRLAEKEEASIGEASSWSKAIPCYDEENVSSVCHRFLSSSSVSSVCSVIKCKERRDKLDDEISTLLSSMNDVLSDSSNSNEIIHPNITKPKTFNQVDQLLKRLDQDFGDSNPKSENEAKPSNCYHNDSFRTAQNFTPIDKSDSDNENDLLISQYENVTDDQQPSLLRCSTTDPKPGESGNTPKTFAKLRKFSDINSPLLQKSSCGLKIAEAVALYEKFNNSGAVADRPKVQKTQSFTTPKKPTLQKTNMAADFNPNSSLNSVQNGKTISPVFLSLTDDHILLSTEKCKEQSCQKSNSNSSCDVYFV